MVSGFTEEEIRAAEAELRRERKTGPSTVQGFQRVPQPESNKSTGFRRIAELATKPLVDVPELPFGFVGDIVEEGVEGLTSPLGIGLTLLAPITGGFSLGLSGAAGVGARVGTRLAAEAAVGGAAGTAARRVSEAIPEDAPGFVKAGLPLLVGGATGVGATAGTRLALRRGAKAAESAIKTVEQALPAEPTSLPLVSALGRAKEQMADPAVRKNIKTRRSAEISGRVREGAIRRDELGPFASADQMQAARRSALRGEQFRPQFPELNLTPDDIENLKLTVERSRRIRDLDRNAARDGLDRLLLQNQLPAKHEIEILERVFGPALTSAIQGLKPYGFKDAVSEIINLPRAVMASFDLSFGGRQGILALGADPAGFVKGQWRSLKAFSNPANARETDAIVRGLTGTPDQVLISNVLAKHNMAITGGAATEELFQTRALFNKALGSSEMARITEASERAYETMGNYLRWVNGQKVVRQLAEKYAPGASLEDGIKAIPVEDLDNLTTTLNVMTGRSGIKAIESGNWSGALNALFFAPNFLASRFRAATLLPGRVIQTARSNPSALLDPIGLYRSDPILALQARSLGGFAGQAIAGAALFKAASAAGIIPDSSIELDPRSSDFGKVRVGSQRYDFFAGYGPIIRTVARASTGETKTSAGQIRDVDRDDVIWDQFLRSKVSPWPALAWNAKTGSTIIGEKVEASDLDAQIGRIIVPLFVQDVLEGIDEQGFIGALKASPALVGFGVMNYASMGEVKDEVAREIFSKQYKDLSAGQRAIADTDPRIVKKVTEWEQMLPSDSFAVDIEKLKQTRMDGENIVMSRLGEGRITRKQAADAILEIQVRATAAREVLVEKHGIESAAPTSALQQALTDWRGLYDLSDEGYADGVKTGLVDWDRYEVLEAELMSRLTDEQKDHIEKRVRAEHGELAESFFLNRDFVNESGYYAVADEEFAKFARRVAAIDPSIETYGQLQATMDAVRLSDPRLYARLNAVLRPVKSRVDKRHEAMRRKDPTLDAALYALGRISKPLTSASKKIILDNQLNIPTRGIVG